MIALTINNVRVVAEKLHIALRHHRIFPKPKYIGHSAFICIANFNAKGEQEFAIKPDGRIVALADIDPDLRNDAETYLSQLPKR